MSPGAAAVGRPQRDRKSARSANPACRITVRPSTVAATAISIIGSSNGSLHASCQMNVGLAGWQLRVDGRSARCNEPNAYRQPCHYDSGHSRAVHLRL